MKFITKAEFRAWLAQFPDDAKPCAELSWCPLEVAMDGVPLVGLRYWWENRNNLSAFERHALLPWAERFVRRVDAIRIGDVGWRRLTAAQMREALR